MGKLKRFFKITATNKMMWVTLVVGTLIIIGTTATVCAISYTKSQSKSTLANADIEEHQEDIIKQEDLADTSKMSEEELQKLNEEELKKTEEKNKKQETTTIISVKNKYYIKVNYGAQVVTIYTYDANGNYTIPVRACICSTGAATPTSGVYRIGGKWVWGALYGNVWGYYTCQVVGDILFHSVPYMQAKNDTLVSAYYDRLGTKDSMGCIRLTTIDAKWIYDNCPSGTQVEFYSSSDPGPLGKPTAQKVSNAPGNLKNWDPTDPDPNNPWLTYEEEENTNQNTTMEPEIPEDSTILTDSEVPTEPTIPTNPEAPAEPEKPVEPTTPTNPEVPAESEEPVEPTTPSNPEVPAEPIVPADPEVPTNPEEPTTPSEPE